MDTSNLNTSDGDPLLDFKVPNLPGWVEKKDTWIYKLQDGFKKKGDGKSRLKTGYRGQASMKSFGYANINASQRPKSASVGIGMRLSSPNGNIAGASQFARPQTGSANGRINYGDLKDTLPQLLPQSVSSPSLHNPAPTAVVPDPLLIPDSPVLAARPAKAKPKGNEPFVKEVLRFFGYYAIRRDWEFFDEQDAPIGTPTVEVDVVHPLTIYYFLENGTMEIKEEQVMNSGVKAGLFYKRNHLYHDPRDRDLEEQEPPIKVAPEDLRVGEVLHVLGQDLFITDADPFTRDWYESEMGFVQQQGEERPDGGFRPDMGAQFTTGFVSTIGKPTEAKGKVGKDHAERRQVMEKTAKFMNFYGEHLFFTLLLLDRDLPPEEQTGALQLGTARKFSMKYYLQDCKTEIGNIKVPESLNDEPAKLLKKTLLERNWKDVLKGKAPDYYTPEDYQVGSVIDVYGRQMLILECTDDTARWYYENLGIDQGFVPTTKPVKETIVHPIPGKNTGFLTIGSEKDTLATVYGQPKPTKDYDKATRNRNRELRCAVEMLSGSGVNKSRKFMLTFYLEDDTIQIYEEAERNSGIASGVFLRRGVYTNELPFNSDVPRSFVPQDIYLGNVLGLNGFEVRITEVDRLSMTFCESCREEFPLFDTFKVTNRVLQLLIDKRINIRSVLTSTDISSPQSGLISRLRFFSEMDGLGLCEELVDQEILTMLSRFETDDNNGMYYFNELCDFMSHLYEVTNKPTVQSGSDGKMYQFLRYKQTQWRRVFRKDRLSHGAFITVDRLFRIFRRHKVPISKQNYYAIIEKFSVPSGTAGTEGLAMPDKNLGKKKEKKEKNNTGISLANTGTATVKRALGSKMTGVRLAGETLTMGGADELTIAGSTIAGTSVSGSAIMTAQLPISPIKVRREALATSLFPRKAKVDEELLAAVEKMHKEACTIINYWDFCDRIYEIGWV